MSYIGLTPVVSWKVVLEDTDTTAGEGCGRYGDRPGGPATDLRACGSRVTWMRDPPRRRWLRTERSSELEGPGRTVLVNAEHRDEVALLSGPAAANDKYVDAPHGDQTVRRPRAAVSGFSERVRS
jgi:hypothetical protein